MKKSDEKNFTGKTAGHLTALFPFGEKDDDPVRWICQCHRCGRVAIATASKLNLNRADLDCGCGRRDRVRADLDAIEAERRAEDGIVEAFYAGVGSWPGRAFVDDVIHGIQTAAEQRRPFTTHGKNGLWERKGELPPTVRGLSRSRFLDMARDLIAAGRIAKYAAPGSNIPMWLDVPGGPVAKGIGL